MTIKTFRGLMADDTQDTIVLHTNDGRMGYRVVKFDVIPSDPRGTSSEAIIKIYTTSQTSKTDSIDFSDQTLIGAAFVENNNTSSYFGGRTIIFDNAIFNQDIYITCKTSSDPINYYIELEQIKLDLSENTVATLKDIRNAARVATT